MNLTKQKLEGLIRESLGQTINEQNEQKILQAITKRNQG